jgi:acyl-CoA synthetase (AMP-forming)/AMP-acid ligase II
MAFFRQERHRARKERKMDLTAILERNARMFPNDIALIEVRHSKGIRKEITWKALNEKANRLANALSERGVVKGDKVLHWSKNSIDWLLVFFGVAKAGAWVVPLNFRFLDRDIKYCADVVEPKVFIMEEEFAKRTESIRDQLPTIKSYVVIGRNVPAGMEKLEDILNESSPKSPGTKIADDDECALFFTSGTTGDPKPVLLTHRNLECTCITEWAHHQQTREDNFVIIPPLYHLGALGHWLGGFIVGARGTILAEFSPQNLFETVQKERGTIVWLVVPWALDILGELDRGSLNKDDYDLSRWRMMHMGGQPIPESVVRRWKNYFPRMQYDTSYAQSESGAPGGIRLGIDNEHKLPAIGKPGFNWDVRIVTEKGEDVAPDEVGEILLRGNAVMKGYYKNPKKTSETIKDGWLYTGDLARYDKEGWIYIVDRKKDMIISGGENVYPVEIEEVLHKHPKVQDVGVIGVPDERLTEVPAAVIQVKVGMALTSEEVMKFCEENLPRYKRPRRIIFDEVPRNPSGKINKVQLRGKHAK